MTGKRVGNPKRRRTFGVCRSCGQERYFKGRRLCETCWAYSKKLGTLTEFPLILNTHPDKNQDPHPHLLCGCFNPINSGGYCLKCDKPVRA